VQIEYVALNGAEYLAVRKCEKKKNFVTLLEIAASVSLDKLWGKRIKSSTISKDEPHEIRNINRTNAVIFRSVTVESALGGHDSCQLKYNYCPQATVALVMHIEVYFM